MMDIKVVAFDCDGVMFDTENANKTYYNSILEHAGKPPMTQEQFAHAQMHTVDDTLSYFFQDKESLEQAQTFRKQLRYYPFIKYMEIEPYLRSLLEKLKPKYKTAIVTNRTDTMDRVLAEHDLSGAFDLVVSALDVDHPKPHPEPLLKVLDYFNVEPDEAIYIGDSKLDEIASNEAGIRLVAYNNKSLSAAFHINSLKEMDRILGWF